MPEKLKPDKHEADKHEAWYNLGYTLYRAGFYWRSAKNCCNHDACRPVCLPSPLVPA